MGKKTYEAPAIPVNYSQLWLTLQSRATAAGIEHNHALTIHRRWRQLGKLAAAGRLK